MSQQRTVSLPTNFEPDDEPVAEKQQTSALFFEYVARRANKDGDLKASETEVFMEEREKAVQVVGEDAATLNVASRLADIGM